MQSSIRDDASSWYTLHMMVTCVHSPTDFLMNAISTLLLFHSAQHSSIHVWGTGFLVNNHGGGQVGLSSVSVTLGVKLYQRVAGILTVCCYFQCFFEQC